MKACVSPSQELTDEFGSTDCTAMLTHFKCLSARAQLNLLLVRLPKYLRIISHTRLTGALEVVVALQPSAAFGPRHVGVVREVVLGDLLADVDVSGGYSHYQAAHKVLGHVVVAAVVEQSQGREDGVPDRVSSSGPGRRVIRRVGDKHGLETESELSVSQKLAGTASTAIGDVKLLLYYFLPMITRASALLSVCHACGSAHKSEMTRLRPEETFIGLET